MRSVSDENETIAVEVWGASSSDVIHAAQVTRPSCVDARETYRDGPWTSFFVDTSETIFAETSSSSPVDADTRFSADARRDLLDDDDK